MQDYKIKPMAVNIYLASAQGRSSKSTVAIGVLDMFLQNLPRVGVFRPLVTDTENDRILRILLNRCGTELSHEECVGVTYEESVMHPDSAMTQIVAKYKALEAKCDAVLIVGSDYADVSAPSEFAFNAQIAATLNAPVLLVLGGRNPHEAPALGESKARGVRELEQLTESAIHELKAVHAQLLGVVVNRTEPEIMELARANISAVSHCPVWTIPDNQVLFAPSVSDLMHAADGELIHGSEDLLDTEALGIVISGMNMNHVLERITPGAVMVIPADRTETLLAVTMAHETPSFPTVAAIFLNGGFEIPTEVDRLLQGIGSDVPVIRTPLGTYDTVHQIMGVRGSLTSESQRKIDIALSLFHEHIDTDVLRESLAVERADTRTPAMFAYELFDRAKQANAHIVLPEGNDDRILRAASTLLSHDIVRLTILGDVDAINQRAGELGLDLSKADLINPTHSGLREEFATEYAKLRAHKGVTVDAARETMLDVSYFGTMMVHLGYADGMVSGAAHTTAHTIKPAFEIIKTKPGVSVVSSVFFMALADRVLVYGDCAVNPDPTSAQLADIAISSAETASQFGVEPKIAMLSYSTGTSGHGADVDKVRQATEIAQNARPDLLLEGPIQYDAASDPQTGQAKLPGSKVAGHATVFIFPDLNTGNNTYKAVQRSAGALAVGPVLQGLNKPVNDLSRGALVDDILNTVAITAVQATITK